MVNNGPLYADLAKLLVKCDERKENLSLNLAAITAMYTWHKEANDSILQFEEYDQMCLKPHSLKT
jgi:hypothetical protein